MLPRNNNNAMWPHRLLALATAALAAPALADQYHYNNILIGDRASGMGGAYTAVSDDTSGLYYNPAGTAYIQTRNISGSVNAYHVTHTTYKDVISGRDWERESTALVPNFFGIAQPLGKGTLGFSYVVTDAIKENQDQRFTGLDGDEDSLTINFNNKEFTYKLGASYARRVSDSLSLGATLYLHMREHETVNNLLITFDDGSQPDWRYVQTQTDEWGVEPVLGLMWTPVDRVSVGLSVRRPIVFASDTYINLTCHPSTGSANATCPLGQINSTIQTSDDKRKYPWEIRAGIAWFPSNSLLLAADLTYFTQTKDPLGDRTLEATWNLHLGMEYYFNTNWAMRAGLYTNRANTPSSRSDFDSDFTSYEHVDLTGLSLSVTRFTRSSSLTAGFSYARGDGEAEVIPGTISDVNASGLTLFLSTTYSF